jgi:hypothetical protein
VKSIRRAAKSLYLVAAAALVLAAGCGKNAFTVNGKVVNHLGMPLAGVMVFVDDMQTFTQSDGRFTVGDVETPYNVVLNSMYSSVRCPPAMVAYQGLTRSDPLITLSVVVVEDYADCSSSPWSASIAGQLSGGAGFPQPADHQACVAFSTQEFFSAVDAEQNGTFSWTNQWTGMATLAGDLYALQWQKDANHLPQTYKGYGTRNAVALNQGSALSNQDLSLGSVGTGEVSGTATLPAGYSLYSRTLGLRVGEYGYLPIVQELPPADTSFTYQAPDLAGGKISVRLEAWNGALDNSTANRVLTPGTSGASMVLPAAVTLLEPADNEPNVDYGTLFAWTPFPGGVHVLILVRDPLTSTRSTWTVVTSAASLTGDSLNSLFAVGGGVHFASTADWQWSVLASTLYPTVDAAASSPLVFGSAPWTFDMDFETALSAFRNFTTP